jgi:hypothetical protein
MKYHSLKFNIFILKMYGITFILVGILFWSFQ